MRLFKRGLKIPAKPISKMLGNKEKIIEAFTFDGIKYFQFEDAFKIPSGRGLSALTIYEEFRMRADYEYLVLHCKAVDKILSDPKKININALALIHNNLKERAQLAAFPNHIFKLASVLFFDESESPYTYDYDYNNKKIEKWKASGGMLDFLLLVPLKELIPSLNMQDANAPTYFRVLEQIDQMHLNDLQEILSKKP